MDQKTVLVTGIGGNVGQGILRNIRSLQMPVTIIGCDIAGFTPGNHLCHKAYKVPYSYDDNYIPQIKKIVHDEKVDLIIPSTDYEVFYLASNKDELGTRVAACDAKIAGLFLDKYLTYKHFSANGIPFAKSWLPKDYDFSATDFIAKPREGRGSRGILINPPDITGLGDTYMIQPLHKGIEITTAIYVNQYGKLHGIFSMERKLENGTTSQTIVNDTYDATFIKIAQQIINLGGIHGSINLQSIVDDSGNIFPFEVNGRISGTNSIRHNLGFQDVKYTIQELLYQQDADPIAPIKGIATRILVDVIYPHATNFDDLNNSSAKHSIY
jgi:carbamoyl-phosphate synthase large subunit